MKPIQTSESPTDRSTSAALPSASPAFTLVEMVGVMAIVVLLAAAVLPSAINQLAYSAQSQETTNLVTFAAGFQRAVIYENFIPNQNGWANFVATNIGWQLGAVQTNSSHNARAFLIDPTLTVGTNTASTLPYTQTGVGSPNFPNNPRFIILSSLSKPLPATFLTNGIPSSADFTNLWATPDNAVPTNSTWTNWTGRGTDLRVQRVSLATSFNQLVLNNKDATASSNAVYSIENWPSTNVANGPPVCSYYFSGTVLTLYLPNTAIEATQVLNQFTSWVFQGGIWRNSLMPAQPTVSTNIHDNLTYVVQWFCTNNCNPHNACQPAQVLCDMTNYMSLYCQYADSGFSSWTLQSKLQATNNCLTWDLNNLFCHP